MREKKVKISPFFSQFWLNFGHFRVNLTQSEISGVFGQNFVPEILKISVGLLSKISDILQNFWQSGSTGCYCLKTAICLQKRNSVIFWIILLFWRFWRFLEIFVFFQMVSCDKSVLLFVYFQKTSQFTLFTNKNGITESFKKSFHKSRSIQNE